jgi:hypothetical protein
MGDDHLSPVVAQVMELDGHQDASFEAAGPVSQRQV